MAVRPIDSLIIASAWAEVRAAVVVEPWALRAVHSSDELRKAVPELFAAPAAASPQWLMVHCWVEGRYSQKDFADRLERALG